MFAENLIGFHKSLLPESLFQNLSALFQIIWIVNEIPGMLLHGIHIRHLWSLGFFIWTEVYFLIFIEILWLLVKLNLPSSFDIEPFYCCLSIIQMIHHILEIKLFTFLMFLFFNLIFVWVIFILHFGCFHLFGELLILLVMVIWSI